MSLDYQKVAGDILFGGDTLDNAARGMFLEAVIIDALRRYDLSRALPPRWRHTGVGWGPWDLQRGSSAAGDRVRVQVKVKAARQLWATKVAQTFVCDLGWKQREKLPAGFDTDFPNDIYGACEISGHRCDLFLIGWCGPNPVTGETRGDKQSYPASYDYFIIPSSDCANVKRVHVGKLFERYQPSSFTDLPMTLNCFADRHLDRE